MIGNQDDFKRWGYEEISKTVNAHVASMQDQSELALAILIYGSPEDDEATFKALQPLAMNTYSVKNYLAFGRPVQICYLGFDKSDGNSFHTFWLCAQCIPRVDEIIIYISGKPVFRSDRLLFDDPPADSVFSTQ